jgi:hypothetical protein
MDKSTWIFIAYWLWWGAIVLGLSGSIALIVGKCIAYGLGTDLDRKNNRR